MSNIENLVKALLGSMFDVCSFKAKNRVFKFDRDQPITTDFKDFSFSTKLDHLDLLSSFHNSFRAFFFVKVVASAATHLMRNKKSN